MNDLYFVMKPCAVMERRGLPFYTQEVSTACNVRGYPINEAAADSAQVFACCMKIQTIIISSLLLHLVHSSACCMHAGQVLYNEDNANPFFMADI